jgi:YD repeat-containing protein
MEKKNNTLKKEIQAMLTALAVISGLFFSLDTQSQKTVNAGQTVVFPASSSWTLEDYNRHQKEIAETEVLPCVQHIPLRSDGKLYGSGDPKNNYLPVSWEVDRTREVGTVEIKSSINPNGTLSYNIPIEVTPNANGMFPQISISYGNMSGNGICGEGWGIGGLSEIVRTGKSLYFDGQISGITMTNDDSFIMDGMRLIVIEKRPNAIIYETQQGMARVTAHLYGGSISYFTVEHPNSVVSTYGFKNNPSSKRSYPITRIEEIHGRSVIYDYETNGDSYYIKDISYDAGHVYFEYYESRPDVSFLYDSGLKFESTRLLQSIAVFPNAQDYYYNRKYTLTYDTLEHDNTTVLSKVDMAGSSYYYNRDKGDGKVNPIHFFYGKNAVPSPGFDYTQTSLSKYSPESYDELVTMMGKVTNDNGEFILTYPKKNAYQSILKTWYHKYSDGTSHVGIDPYIWAGSSTSGDYAQWYVDLLNYPGITKGQTDFDFVTSSFLEAAYWPIIANDYGGEEDIYIHSVLDESRGVTHTMKTGAGFVNLICANIDGVEGDEIIKFNVTDRLAITVYSYTPSSGFKLLRTITPDGGLNTLFRSFPVFEHWYAYDHPGTDKFDPHKYVQDNKLIGDEFSVPKYFFSGDFNGDGKQELMIVTANNPLDRYWGSTSDGSEFDMRNWVETKDYTNHDWNDYKASGMPYREMFHTDKTPSLSTRCVVISMETGNILFEKSGLFEFNRKFGSDRIFLPSGSDHEYMLSMSEANAEGLSDRITLMDYDADGKADICLMNENGMNFYSFKIENGVWNCEHKISNSYFKRDSLYERQYVMGEFNGDGKADFFLTKKLKEPSSLASFYYSKGNGDFDIFSGTQADYDSTEVFIAQDVDNDGISDILKRTPSGIYTYPVSPYEKYKTLAGTFTYLNSGSILAQMSINTQSQISSICFLDRGTFTKLRWTGRSIADKLLTGVVTSTGVIDQNHYGLLSIGTDFYKKGNNAVYPYMNLASYLWVPVKREKYHDGKMEGDVSLKYENAVTHLEGLGFLGYEKMTSIDNIKGTKEIRTYDPFNCTVLVEEETPTVLARYHHTVNVLPNRLFRSRLDSSSVYDKLNITNVKVSNIYDDYLNVVHSESDNGEGLKSVTDFDIVNNTSGIYRLGLVKSQKTVTTLNGKTIASKNVNEYDSIFRLKCVKKYVVNGTQDLLTSTERFVFDNAGNVIKSYARPYESPDSTYMVFDYDKLGRKVLETNELGMYTGYKYEPIFQVMYEEYKNIFGGETPTSISTTATYDGLFRKIKIDYLFNDRVTIEYRWTNPGEKGLYCEVTTSNINPQPSTVYFDAFGRKVRESSHLFNGKLVHADMGYDVYGRKDRVSLPFFDGEQPKGWTVNMYDEFDRVVSVSAPGGKVTNTVYGVRTKKVTENGMWTKSYYDASGNVLKTESMSGTSYNFLRPDGNPDSTVFPGGLVTKYEYDAYGRSTAVSNSVTGRTSMTYNISGYVDTKTDAEGNKIFYNYDKYGRVVNEKLPEFSITYEYGKNSELLKKTMSNGVEQNFLYDNYCRPVTDRTTFADGKDTVMFQKLVFFMNSFVRTVDYSSNIAVLGKETYDYTNGVNTKITFLSEGKQVNQKVWELDDVNVFGSHTQGKTGPLTRYYTYNDYGMTTSRKAVVTGTNNYIYNDSYEFDITSGNLLSRKDEKRNITEKFFYDDFHRLVSYGNNVMSYDSTGNITRKSDIGDYHYKLPNPYAVSKIKSVRATPIPVQPQEVQYTTFKRPSVIREKDYTAEFTYGATGERIRMKIFREGKLISKRLYISDCYEREITPEKIVEYVYINGTPYNAPAVFTRKWDTKSIHGFVFE